MSGRRAGASRTSSMFCILFSSKGLNMGYYRLTSYKSRPLGNAEEKYLWFSTCAFEMEVKLTKQSTSE